MDNDTERLNMLLSQIDLPGVNLKVRDHREWMNESLDKRAEHLARVELAARSNHQVEVNEEAAMRQSGKLDLMKINLSVTADKVICQGVNVQIEGVTTDELVMEMAGMQLQALLEDVNAGYLVDELESRGYTVTKDEG